MSDSRILIEQVCKDGTTQQLDISREATLPFGFLYQDRVTTPLGPGTVLGVSGGRLYFLLDTDSAASYWSDCHSAADFDRVGVVSSRRDTSARVLAATSAGYQSEYHNLKKVTYLGLPRVIVMQSANGPCPVIALANALILRGDLELVQPAGSGVGGAAGGNGALLIQATSLRAQLLSFLQVQHRKAPPCRGPAAREGKEGAQTTLAGIIALPDALEEMRQRLWCGPDAEQSLKKFYGGLDVSPIFSHIDGFDGDDESAFFAMAGVRLVHGWVFGELSPFASLRNLSYSEIQLRAFEVVEVEDEGNTDSSNIAALARDVLTSQQQLTVEGLDALRSGLEEGEICVQFYNNHFSTIVKLNGFILRLLSDVSFVDRSLIVFERLLDTQGSVDYVDGSGNAPELVMLEVQSRIGDRFSEDEIILARSQLFSERLADPTADEIIRLLEQRDASVKAPSAINATNTNTSAIFGGDSNKGQNTAPAAAGGTRTSASVHSSGVPLLETRPSSVDFPRPGAETSLVDEKAQQLLAMGLCTSFIVAKEYVERYKTVEAAVDAILNG